MADQAKKYNSTLSATMMNASTETNLIANRTTQSGTTKRVPLVYDPKHPRYFPEDEEVPPGFFDSVTSKYTSPAPRFFRNRWRSRLRKVKPDVVPTSTGKSLLLPDVVLHEFSANETQEKTAQNGTSKQLNSEEVKPAQEALNSGMAECVVNCEKDDASKEKQTSMLSRRWVLIGVVFLSVFLIALIGWAVLLFKKRVLSESLPLTSGTGAATVGCTKT